MVVNGEQKRRSLYIQVRRSRPVGMLQAFDAPVMETNCEKRSNSTVATQSLMLLNGEFIRQQASHFAATIRKQAPAKDTKTLSASCVQALQRAFCRKPSSEERRIIAGFVSSQLKHVRQHPQALPKGVSAEKQVLTNFCQVLLSSNEFLYLD